MGHVVGFRLSNIRVAPRRQAVIRVVVPETSFNGPPGPRWASPLSSSTPCATNAALTSIPGRSAGFTPCDAAIAAATPAACPTVQAGGITADLPTRVGRILEDLRMKNYARAVEDIAPRAISNILAARRLYAEGATNRRGSPILDLETFDQLRLSERDAVLKALGFQPQTMARHYEKDRILRMVQGEKAAAKRDFVTRLFLAAKTGDMEGYGQILAEIGEYNQAMALRNRDSLMLDPRELDKTAQRLLNPANLPSAEELQLYWELFQRN